MKRSYEREMMDLPGQPRELLEEGLANLRAINRYLGNYRNVTRGLACLLREQKLARFSLLDVGTGSGDVPAAVARWARKKGIAAAISALEREPVTVAQAALQTRNFPEVTVVRGDCLAPPFRPASFDFVLASQLLHHFSEEQIIRLLRIWSPLARRAIVVSDLVRHPPAYYGIRLVTTAFTRNVMTRTDGPLSVKRAFTLTEWRGLFRGAEVGPFQIYSAFPFRMRALLFPKG